MQLGPKIRVGGSVGKLGDKLKHGAGNMLAQAGTVSIGGHKFMTNPLAFLTNPLAKKLQGGTDSQAFHSLEDTGRSALRSAGVAGGLMAGQAALPSLPGFGGGASGAVPGAGASAGGGAAGGAATAAATGAPGAAVGGSSFFGNMSLADKLAMGSTLLNGIGGVAGGIAQGKQWDTENQQYKDRLAAMQRFRTGLQPPAPFNPTSAFAGQGAFQGQNGPPQNGPPGAPPQLAQNPLMQNNPLAQGGGGENPWQAILRARGMA